MFTRVMPAANGPVTVTRLPATLAVGAVPSSSVAPLVPDGRSITSGPPMSTRARALLRISST